MIRKKIFLFPLSFLLAIALVYGLSFGIRYAYIGSSYDAKIVCSCMFVSHRSLVDIRAEDLYAVPFAHLQVDQQNKTVTSDIYGMAKVKAIYRPGLGCTLLNDITAEVLLHQPAINRSEGSPDTLRSLSPLPASVDSQKLSAIVDRAFTETDHINIKRTRAVIILYAGKIIAEKYGEHISPDMPLLGWSMTKSVTNAMIGILVKDGKLSLHQTSLFDAWKKDDRSKINLDHLLRMSSGLSFDEDYTSPSDATNMLFREPGAGKYAMQQHSKAPPGTIWYYSSGTTNILQELIRQQFKSASEYQAFPHNRLFDKIGMRSAVLEPDASGTYIGSSFMYATARDWAKFGQLYLQDGVWNGERILPEGWVKYSSTETPHSEGRYAAHFWINHQDPSFPQDAFYADGYEGQYVVIIPAKRLVIVRLGCSQKESFDINPFVQEIAGTVQ